VGSDVLGQTGSRLKRLENLREFEASTAGSAAGNVRINVIFRRVRATIFAVEKQLVQHYIFRVSVSVALVIHHAKRMLRTVLSSVACLTLPYFSTLQYPINGIIFDTKKNVSGHEMCVLIFSTTSV